MKKKYIVPILIFIICNTSQGNGQYSVKFGGNYSYLKNHSYGESGVDVMYGIGKDWKIYRCFKLGTELLISDVSTSLKDKSVQISYYVRDFPYLPDEAIPIRYYDIDVQLRYVEIPVLIKLEKSLSEKSGIGLEAGFSLRFVKKNASQATVQKSIRSTELTDEERERFRFDYRFTGTGENYSYCGRGLCPILGMYVRYSKIQIGLRYQIDYVDWIESIVIGYDTPLYSFNFSIGYQF